MNASQKLTLSSVCVLGLAVVLSYIPIAKEQLSGKYDYWLGLSQSNRNMAYVLQALAAIGFVAFILQYCLSTPPNRGLFSYHGAVVPSIVTLLLLASLAWSVVTMYYVRSPSTTLKILAVASLIVTAVCAILLLAGYVETQASEWYILLGLLLFCVVTVLMDGVAWSSLIFQQ